MGRNIQLLEQEIQTLRSWGFKVASHNNYAWVYVEGLTLPGNGVWRNRAGQAIKHASAVIDIPPSFPQYPPGVGYAHPTYAIHAPYLSYNGSKIRDLTDCQCRRGENGWWWLCFEKIEWDPRNNGLFTLVEVIEDSLWQRAK